MKNPALEYGTWYNIERLPLGSAHYADYYGDTTKKSRYSNSHRECATFCLLVKKWDPSGDGDGFKYEIAFDEDTVSDNRVHNNGKVVGFMVVSPESAQLLLI